MQFSEVARSLQAEPSLDATLQAVVDGAVANSDSADYVGITRVLGRTEVTTPASTDDLVMQIDRIQYDIGQGPCLSTFEQDITGRAGICALIPSGKTH